MKQLLSDFLNSGSAKQQAKKRLVAMILCATAVLLAIALVTLMIASIATALKNKAPTEPEENESGSNKIPSGYTTTTFEGLYSTSQGNLLLIDADHAYEGTPEVILFDGHESRPKDAENKNVYSIGGRYDLSATNETVVAFNAMVEAFYAASSDNNLYIASAYNKNAANQKAGFEMGTTIELKYYVYYNNANDNELASIYGVETYEWIYKNAAAYGFVQVSAEEGSENIFRYVGAAHATYMKSQNKTLAEYLELLQTRGYRSPLNVTVTTPDGKSAAYSVYYLSATEEAVVPTKNSYTVSGNNMGGYIVTVDKTAKVN